jgi:PAS domain S-box-containing protein
MVEVALAITAGLALLAVVVAVARWVSLRGAARELASARDELRVILEAVADGITAQDTSGRLVYVNDAAVRAMGFDSAEELLRTPTRELLARFEILDVNGRAYDLDRLPGRRALGGEPANDTVRFRVRATGDERYVVIKARPVRAPGGQTALAINILEDVTEQKAVERAQRFLSEVSVALAQSLDYETTLQTVVRLAVPAVADRALIDHEVPVDDVERADAVRAVLESGDPELRPGLIVAPLVARGRTLAALGLMRTDAARPYDASDLEVAVEVGRRAGLALDNARLFSDRAYTARALQHSLLPPVLPAIPGLEVASRFRPAGSGEVGGDFYDLFEVGDGGWALVVGDVCGKGPDAAAVTALARYTIRAAAMQRSYPSHILTLLNEAMLRQPTPRAGFCTVALGRFEVHGDRTVLVLATAGHPLPLLLTADGDVRTIGKPGALLGVLEDPELRDEAFELGPADVVVFYTDGVTEAGAPHRVLDPDALRELVASSRDLGPSALAARIEAEAVSAADGELRDDVAILVARVRPAEVDAAELVGPAEVGV